MSQRRGRTPSSWRNLKLPHLAVARQYLGIPAFWCRACGWVADANAHSVRFQYEASHG